MTFKQRVHNEIIAGAAFYKEVFVDYEYLIFSDGFSNKPYYIIRAEEDNYPHLTGVNALVPAQVFYIKCLDGSLLESDFDFSSKNRSEKEVKGSVRRKINVLPLLSDFFKGDLQAEEDFVKGKVHCSLATADNQLTMGFVDNAALRPKTLLKNNELNSQNTVNVALVLRKSRDADKFDTVIQGDVAAFCKSFPGLYACNDIET